MSFFFICFHIDIFVGMFTVVKLYLPDKLDFDEVMDEFGGGDVESG